MESIPKDITDLGSIAGVAMVAVLLGIVFVRLRQPPIVGYILAGILLGPTGLGLVHQSHSIELLAELGVLLLLFLIGMEISIRAFVRVLAPALLVAGGQLLAGLTISALFGLILGWSLPQIVLLGFIVAVSSTAVAIKILEEIDELRTATGRIAIGVLIAQDIAIAPMLIIAEGFGGNGSFSIWTIVTIVGSVALIGALIWYLNTPGKLRLPFTAQLTGKPDMIALGALALCFSAATLSGLFGLSPVYGAFIAGLIVANSTLRQEAIELTFPVQSILVFVFFLSVGLLIDLNYILQNWATVFAFVILTVAAKTVLNITLVRACRMDWQVAFPAGLAMAQIGEFSFLLAAVGIRNGALDYDAYRLALAVIAMTLVFSRRFHEVTAKGLTGFREALALTYEPELHEWERGLNTLARMRYRVRVYRRAAMMAWHRRSRKASEQAEAAANAADPDSTPMLAFDPASPPEPSTEPNAEASEKAH